MMELSNMFDNISKILYLGPEGSYSEIAKNKFVEKFGIKAESYACNSIAELVKSVYSCENSVVVLPIENSVEGMVRETLDSLSCLAENGFKIFSETTIKVEHALISYTDSIAEIMEVYSHPQALAQCREYILSDLRTDVKQIPLMSTSQAVKLLLEDKKSSKAAIASEYCANLYNVPILKSGINDEKNNATRFIILAKEKPYKTADSKVCISFSTINEPGALNKVLTVIEKYNLNMSQICSRPSKKSMGEYVFYIDFTGYIEDENVTLAINDILNNVTKLEILSEGSINIV